MCEKIKTVVSVALVMCTSALLAGDALIQNKVVRQRWPWSGKVDVDYLYTGDTVTSMTFTATWRGQSEPTNLVGIASAGAFRVKPGQNRFEWNPADFGLSSQTLLDFDVQIAPVASDPRTYLIVDLVNGGYSFLPDVPAGGWSDEYKTSKVVFRRIPAGTYTLGATEADFRAQFGNNGTAGNIGRGATRRTITYTSDYYFQVFAFTSAQYSRLYNASSTDGTMLPVTGTKFSYSSYRGAMTDDGATAISWPDTGHKVNSTSLVGRMRARTAGSGQAELLVDLPTDVQWQLAVSAGTNTLFTTGGAFGDSEETISNLVLAAFWTKSLDKTDPKDYEVGLKAPNPWGIYDFNVRQELVLDWLNDDGTYIGSAPRLVALSETAVDPVGPLQSALGLRLTRGGEANGGTYAPRDWTIYTRGRISPDEEAIYRPPRFVINLKPIVEVE